MNTVRVFVVGAYIPNGGTFMAYHVARILHQDFSFEVIAVGEQTPDHSMFDYEPVFPSISVDEMEASISRNDILIANPSFSSMGLGFKCPGRKLMYVQGFTTFSLLDCRFDRYVSVSQFVQKFLLTTYNINTVVVSPFIRAEIFPDSLPWSERPHDSILVWLKGDERQQRLLLDHVRQRVAARVPGVRLDNVLTNKIPQRELAKRLGESRYFMTLSCTEGFGLVPLEAMAQGTTVVGFDGFGGRDYMQSGLNCEVTAYPDIEGVADRLVALFSDPDRSQSLAENGRITSRRYSYDRFRDAWRVILRDFVEAGAGLSEAKMDSAACHAEFS